MILSKIENTCSMMELGRLHTAIYFGEDDPNYYVKNFKKLLENDLTFHNGVIICNCSSDIYEKAIMNLGFKPKFKYEGVGDVTTYILHIKSGKPYKYNWFTRFFNNM